MLHSSLTKFIKQIIPWIITAAALYFTFKDIAWNIFLSHLESASKLNVAAAIFLACLSYIFRGRRWQSLFHEKVFSFADSTRVLVLGFFYNNILPARAGEFVRAHLGAQLSKQPRTLVLATIAAERLIDGLTISLMFIVCAVRLGDHGIAHNLLIVSGMFAMVGIGVVLSVIFRTRLRPIGHWLKETLDHGIIHRVVNMISVFLEGLSPLCTWSKIPALVFWSIIIWCNELMVFYLIAHGYGAMVTLPEAVFVMVAINFATLIPAAPGGLGVVEAIGSAALGSLGIAKELALIIVLSQHVMQYLVVGIPGAMLTLTWRKRLEKLEL